LVPVTSDTASGQIAAGSYPENDARLSDTALKWMLDTATSVGLVHDQYWLSLFPDAAGPQHDEKRIGVYRHTRTLVRKVPPDVFCINPCLTASIYPKCCSTMS
jgi:hypothetical protein